MWGSRLTLGISHSYTTVIEAVVSLSQAQSLQRRLVSLDWQLSLGMSCCLSEAGLSPHPHNTVWILETSNLAQILATQAL